MAENENEVDEYSGVETTGHVWDGIKELNNPLPRWWLITWYVCIAISIVYMIFMPAWPGITGYTKGLRNHSERANVAAAMADLDAGRNETLKKLLTVKSVGDIEQDPDLLQLSMAAGASLFGDNCATCHGSGGQGFTGYPNLVDDDWLWGGTFAAIQQTLQHGVRAEDPETRINLMLAYGRDGMLPREQISDLVEYVTSLSGGEADAQAVARAAPIFAQTCAACHGADGKGIQALGAPNLTDGIWLYGGERQNIHETLQNGRGGVMPAWTTRLSDEQIVALAVYVHSLGGGE
ncbi:Cytochrome c oxidase (cbb3-type) subunit CcoP [hydrothermal vent metagenome]|uniref:Cytochrome c oxidase subunit III n=1 Tax=hydrothermal vent metagenome TaxID=652676 RepID=A0A3B0SF26_9ZZZZ